jgi:hypothetical protein
MHRRMEIEFARMDMQRRVKMNLGKIEKDMLRRMERELFRMRR